jgi:hypothetical protein
MLFSLSAQRISSVTIARETETLTTSSSPSFPLYSRTRHMSLRYAHHRVTDEHITALSHIHKASGVTVASHRD